jgi:alpha-amylase
LRQIFDKLSDLNTTYFAPGSKPFAMHEVTPSGGEISVEEYTRVGKVMEFRYFDNMQSIIRKHQNRYLASLSQFGRSWGFLDDADAVAVMDNHDIQRGDNGDFSKVITYRQSRMLKMANAYMLAWPYGTVKLLSSYYWPEYLDEKGHDVNNWYGPPHEDNFEIKHVTVNPDQTCGSGWVCEHRWRQIENMVQFRNTVTGVPVTNWWSNGFHQIAFGRQGRGFIAINNEDFWMKQTLTTSLPEGLYCDVITGYLKDNKCTGRQIYVNEFGHALIEIDNHAEDPIVAIHVNAKLH